MTKAKSDTMLSCRTRINRFARNELTDIITEYVLIESDTTGTHIRSSAANAPIRYFDVYLIDRVGTSTRNSNDDPFERQNIFDNVIFGAMAENLH